MPWRRRQREAKPAPERDVIYISTHGKKRAKPEDKMRTKSEDK